MSRERIITRKGVADLLHQACRMATGGDVLRVVVVGAGVVGLSTAHHLLERFPGQLELTLVAEQFSPYTTSDKAGVILVDVDFRTKEEKESSIYNQTEDIMRWTRATFRRFRSLYQSEENASIEITVQHGYHVFTPSAPAPLRDPWWKDEVFGFRHVKLGSVEANMAHVPPDAVEVWSFGTYFVDATSYLNWLSHKVKQGGAKIQQRKISNLDELSSYDIIINCTGIGSCDLLNDRLMYPNRGQVVLVRAPWLRTWFMQDGEDKDSTTYILPRSRDVVLGGTTEAGNWSETPDPTVARRILEKCQKFVPSLARAEVIREWSGLRPQRDPIRLDCSDNGPGGSMLVHCYGHGGKGVVLSWGCALDIGDMVHKKLSSPKANL